VPQYRILFRQPAKEELARIRKFDQLRIRDAIAQYLATDPLRESRSRIKQIHAPHFSGYRLRIDAFRIFYTVRRRTVNVLRVMRKDAARRFLRRRRDKSEVGSRKSEVGSRKC